MQLKRIEVTKLFGSFNHKVEFQRAEPDSRAPTVVVLHGRNGVGKTTLLRMLSGATSLDFTVFREVPFDRFELEFDSEALLAVVPKRKGGRLVYLEASFSGVAAARLHPEHPGEYMAKDASSVFAFRRAYEVATEEFALDFIDTERLSRLRPGVAEAVAFDALGRPIFPVPARNAKGRVADQSSTLAARVRRFISEAQVNYRKFFATTEPDLFPRILERLTTGEAPTYEIADLRRRLKTVHEQDVSTAHFGLERDRWDHDQLQGKLKQLAAQRRNERRAEAITVLGSYVEHLESRAAERALVADRLVLFEQLLSEFFVGKRVRIDARRGFAIESDAGGELSERQLSSGEFHLLYLMVAALVTKRRGTVIAIDEPEMSMHIAWQRKLIPALIEVATKAEPLLILATHSPDLAASCPQALVELG